MVKKAETYSELRQQLDDTLAQLQNPECDIDQAAALYQQAVQLVGRLEAYLQQTENKVRKVQDDLNADGLVG